MGSVGVGGGIGMSGAEAEEKLAAEQLGHDIKAHKKQLAELTFASKKREDQLAALYTELVRARVPRASIYNQLSTFRT